MSHAVRKEIESLSFFELKARINLAKALADSGVIAFTIPPRELHYRLRAHDDLRHPGPYTNLLVSQTVQCLRHLQVRQNLTFDGVVGVPGAGARLAAAFARLVQKPCLVLEDRGRHGEQVFVLAESTPSDVRKVLIIDGATTASTQLRVINALDEHRVWVSDVLTLVDEDLGEQAKLEAWGCKLYRIFTTSELLDIYTTAGLMPQARSHAVPSFTPQAA